MEHRNINGANIKKELQDNIRSSINSTNVNLLRRNLRAGLGGRLSLPGTPRELKDTNKKLVFTPNIPVRREKVNDSTEKSRNGNSTRNRSQPVRENRSSRGRGRGRGRGEFIQTSGSVFGQGPADRMIKKEYSQRVSESSVEMPKYTPVAVKTKIEREEDDEKLKELLRDDFLDDDYAEDDLKPVSLPLVSFIKCKDEMKQEPKQEFSTTKIKKEPLDDDDDYMDVDSKDTDLVNAKQKVKNDNEFEDVKTVEELFTPENIPGSELLLFFQFPDCSLQDCISDDDVSSSSKSNTSSQVKGCDDKNQGKNSSIFETTKEGHIGKLQILKSGKVRFCLGSMHLSVQNGTQVGFLQELVSVNMENGDSDMYILGHVNDRLVCLPDIKSFVAHI